MNSLAVAEIEGGVMFTLPMTGARIEAQWRNARPHDVHDCFVGLQRKCEMHETLVLGMESIRSGLASEYTVGAIEAYQRQTLIVERAILDSIYLALDLTLMPPNGIEWRSLFPAASDALLSVVNSIRWMIGLSPEDRVNLETCALAALGLRPTPHVGGLCPLAPAIPWRPRAKCVWDDWRDIKQGGTVTLYILHLDGFPVLDAILAEMQAAEMTAEVNRWLAKS